MATESEIKISKSKIKLQKDFPFFAYLSLFLKPKEVKDEKNWEEGGLGMGVDISGNLFYNPNFVNKLREEELTGCLIHELGHLMFLTMTRTKNLNPKIFNIASDITINEILKDNNFILPKGVIWSNNEREVKVFNKVVEKCNTKTSEEIYWEIFDEVKKQVKKAIKKGKVKFCSSGNEGEGIEIDIEELGDYEIEGSGNNGDGKIRNFDKHIKGKGGKELSEEEKRELEGKWMERIHEAYTMSKIAGKEPLGIERVIGKLHESKIGWRQLLQRYIQSSIPSDFTYSRPNKKSISSGVYMPDVYKEKIEIAIGIDVSGSIGNEELNDFLSEIVGMARTFRERIKMTLFTHETDVVNEWIIENGNVQKILSLKIKGGGGTSFVTPYKTFIEKHRDTKLILWLTDGFGDTIPKNILRNDIIWILSKNGSDELIKNTGRIIKLK